MKYLFVVVMLMTWLLTWCMRRYALAKKLMDIPNERSSHVHPTPRGGGIAFIFVFFASTLSLIFSSRVAWPGAILLMSALFLTAAVGFWDDKKSLSAAWRLIGQAVACGLVLSVIGPIPNIVCFHWVIPSGYWMKILAFFYLIWLLNLYNFMDGIDGLASSEAFLVCCGMSVIYGLTGYHTQMIMPLMLAATMGGFLFWNFPPARIFMGDAGSSFLGLVLGIFSLQSIQLNPAFIWCWLILLGVFIVDATWTLMIRCMHRERIYQAHCKHAYQHAARSLGRHLPVTSTVMMLNMVWLFPIALLVGLGFLNGFIGLIFAYLPLLILAIQFNAGH